MLKFGAPLSEDVLAHVTAKELLKSVRSACAHGREMHPEALKAVVFKLTAFSGDLNLKQHERDEAADMANLLANAALKAHGPHSEYSRDLVAGIQVIARRSVA